MKASQGFRFEDLTILPPEKKLEQPTNTDRRSLALTRVWKTKAAVRTGLFGSYPM